MVGDGRTFEEALENIKSAINFHLETFGDEVLEQITAAKGICL